MKTAFRFAVLIKSWFELFQAIEEIGTNSATVTLTVQINDINDHAIQCSPMVYYVSINEGSASGK